VLLKSSAHANVLVASIDVENVEKLQTSIEKKKKRKKKAKESTRRCKNEINVAIDVCV